jgi:O-antigen ligase
VSALVDRSRRYLLVYGGALLLAVVVGAVLAYSERFGGDNGPYILLGTLLGIAAAVAIMLQWRLGAILLAASLPFEATLTLGPLASGIKALALLTFFSLALALLTDHKVFERFVRLMQLPLSSAMVAFVLWILVSILWASYKGLALRETATFMGVFGLMVVFGLLERRYLVMAWVALAVSAALSVPAGYILPVPAGSDMAVSGRFGPGGADPNSYACLLAIAFFVAFFGLPRRYRMISYILAPVFLYGIFATASRTGLVALLATPLLALLVPRLAPRLGWRIVLMYVLGAAALAVIVLVFPWVGTTRGESVTDRYMTLSQPDSVQTWSGRLSIWQGAVDVIASHPILGVGAGNFSEFAVQDSSKIAAHSAAKGQFAGVAHNMFLGVASQMGIVGLILFLCVLFLAFKTVVSIARESSLGTGIFLGLIVAVFAGMTLTWEKYEIMYVLLGSVLALQLHASARRGPPPGKHEGFS